MTSWKDTILIKNKPRENNISILNEVFFFADQRCFEAEKLHHSVGGL